LPAGRRLARARARGRDARSTGARSVDRPTPIASRGRGLSIASAGRELTGREATMTAMMSWFLTVLGVLGLVIVLHHLGVDLTAAIGSALHGAEQLLGRPLVSF
jgi:hypothetical protein